MGYSCSDFTDDIIDALDVTIPGSADDSPSDQADICLAEIERLQTARAVLTNIRADNPEFETGAMVDHADVTARLAKRWPEIAAALADVPMLPVAPSPGIDWRTIARDLAGALSSTVQQIEQMEGMFDDEDNAIAESLQDANAALDVHRNAGKIAPTAPTRARTLVDFAHNEYVQPVLLQLQKHGGNIVSFNPTGPGGGNPCLLLEFASNAAALGFLTERYRDDSEEFCRSRISNVTATATRKVWTCFLDGDEIMPDITVHATEADALAYVRESLDLADDEEAGADSGRLSELWDKKNEGACIIESHDLPA